MHHAIVVEHAIQESNSNGPDYELARCWRESRIVPRVDVNLVHACLKYVRVVMKYTTMIF